jgi:hypothetical protein
MAAPRRAQAIMEEEMRLRLEYMVSGLLCLIASCRSGSGPVDDFSTERANVEGRVTDMADRPLRGVLVTIIIRPGSSPFMYATGGIRTDSLGRFSTGVARVARVAPAPNPDTLTVDVVATANGPEFAPLPTGAFASSTVPTRLQFVSRDAQVPVATVAIRLATR